MRERVKEREREKINTTKLNFNHFLNFFLNLT